MELRQLKYFVRVVDLGSFSSAAKDLYIAQPALSAQISKLEDELNVKILTRSVRGVSTTQAGEALYLHAQAVLRQIECLKTNVSNIGAKPSGPVSIGIPTSAANILVGPLIGAVQEKYPDIQLQIVESLSGHLQELVSNGRLEMCLLFEPIESDNSNHLGNTPEPARLRRIPLIDEELFLIGKKLDDENESSAISLERVSTLPLVLPGKPNLTRKLIEDVFHRSSLSLRIVAEIDSLSTIQSIVESGHAYTILSMSAMNYNSDVPKFHIRSIGDGRLRRRLSLCMSDIVGINIAAESVSVLIPQLVKSSLDLGNWRGASPVKKVIVPQSAS